MRPDREMHNVPGGRYSAQLRAMLADKHVRSELMPAMSNEELRLIEQRIDPLMAAYEEWCQRWPLIRPDLLLVTAMHALVHAPHLSLDAMMPYLKMSVWNVALDDAFDAGDADEALLAAVTAELLMTAARVPTNLGRSELARGLEEIVEDLSKFPNFAAIYPLWLTLFARSVEGMMYEYFIRKRFSPLRFSADLPALAEYLHFATHSLTVVFLFTASLIVEPTDKFMARLPQVLSLVERCSMIVRLVNDMRTFERELQEGSVNAVTLLVHDRLKMQPTGELGTHINEAKAEIRALIDDELLRADRECAEIRSGTGVEDGFVRATRFEVDMYLKEDYRDWLTSVERAMHTSGPKVR